MKRTHGLPYTPMPATDPRVKQLDTRMKKEGYRPDALIEILHAAQNAWGYLPMPVLQHISLRLRIPPARVFSTVTFYHFFSLKSQGEHTCLICTGTACYVKGAQQLLEAVEQTFGVQVGEVSADNKLGVQAARCIGACGLAPAVVLDEEVQAKIDAAGLVAKIKEKLEAI